MGKILLKAEISEALYFDSADMQIEMVVTGGQEGRLRKKSLTPQLK